MGEIVMKQFGTVPNRPEPDSIELKPGDVGYMGNELSPETKRSIDEIEANMRSARANAGRVFFD